MQSLYWLINSSEYDKPTKKVRDFANRYIKLALETRNNPKSDRDYEKKRFSLLEAMVEDTTDPIELRDQIHSLLTAGRENTANLLSWTFLLLSQHPAIYSKLRTIILTDFGSGTGKLDFATLKTCRYLQYVMNETQRVYPVTLVNIRVAVRDTVLPTGGGADGTKPLAVRKGQWCDWIVYGLHKREDVWVKMRRSSGPSGARVARWTGITFRSLVDRGCVWGSSMRLLKRRILLLG